MRVLRLKSSSFAVILFIIIFFVIPVQATTNVQVKEAPSLNQKISLELKAADIRDVLQMMAKMTQINVVADKSVVGEVSVSLQEVPYEQALDMVIKANGFDYRWVGDILLVASEERMNLALEEPMVKAFTLKHASPESVKAAVALIIDEKNMVAGPSSNTLIVKALPSQLSTVSKLIETIDVEKETAKEPLQTKVFNLEHIAPEEIVSPLKEAIEENMLLVPRDRVLVARGTSAQLETIQELVTSLDRPEAKGSDLEGDTTATSLSPEPVKEPEKMVTEIVQLNHATTEAAKEALSLILSPENGIRVLKEDRSIAIRGTEDQVQEALNLLAEIDKPVRQVLIEARVEEISVDALRELGIDWDATLDGWTLETSTEITGNNFNLAKVGSGVTAQLKVLEQSGDSVVLANPKVAVLDGEEASIHIGDRIPIVIDKKETDENGNVVITTSIEYIEVGIKLDVAPRINSQGYITAKVKPEVSSIVGETNQGYPEIRTRTAETRMTLTNGDTMVLGGLIQEEEIETLKKVPVLGEIPVFGKLFQSTSKDKKQTEIIIFLTPTIIPLSQE